MSGASAARAGGSSASPENAALTRMLLRHHTLREAVAVNLSTMADPALTATTIAQLRERWTRVETRRSSADRNRAAQVPLDRLTASSMFMALCEHEGLDPAAVAAATIPRPVGLLPGDGHPWLRTGSAEHRGAMLAQGRRTPRILPRSAGIRNEEDPRGGVTASRNGLAVGAVGRIGRAVFRIDGTTGWLWLTDDVPHAVRAAAVGRRLDAIIDHPVLRGAGNVVIAGPDLQTDVGGTRFWFRSAPTILDARGLTVPGAPPLFTDPALGGTDAVGDVVLRMALAIRERGLFPNAALLLHQARARICGINAARPHEPRLPPPTREQVEAAAAPPDREPR